jgi:hypothetical protein
MSKHHTKDQNALLSSQNNSEHRLGYGLDNWGVGIRLPAWQEIISLLYGIQISTEANWASHSVDAGEPFQE